MSATGKMKDVSRLNLETLEWNSMVPEGTMKSNELEQLEVEFTGDYPPRGYAMKNLVTTA